MGGYLGSSASPGIIRLRIPEILQHALPMFERVLSDAIRPLLPMRIATFGHKWAGEETADWVGMVAFLVPVRREKRHTLKSLIILGGSGTLKVCTNTSLSWNVFS
jgi:hypothetical protein